MVTEDPTPGQAVIGSSPAASLVNDSTIRPGHDRFSCMCDGGMCVIRLLSECVPVCDKKRRHFSLTFQQAFVSQIKPNKT